MTVYVCDNCGHSKEITDSRLEYGRSESIWCPRCVDETPHKIPQEEY